MRRVLRSFVPCLLLVFAAPLAQDPQPDPAVLQHAQELARTGAPHRVLARLCATWDIAIETPQAGGGEPRRDSGTAVGTTVLGGRYVALDHSLQLAGHPVHALQLLGFDMLRELYTSSWRDDLSTWAVEAAGPASEQEPDLLVLRGTLVDAANPTGRAFRMAIDLRTPDVVTVRVLGRVDEGDEARGDVVLQTQRWTKRG